MLAIHVSLTPESYWSACLSVKMHTTVENDFCITCYERPPVLRDRFCWAEGVVAQDRFYCIIEWFSAHIGDLARSNCPDQNISLLCVSIEDLKELLSRYRQHSTLNYITGFVINVVIAKCCRMKNGYTNCSG